MNNSDLYSVVRTLGEAVTIEQKIGNVALTRRAKMGAITATRGTFNLVDRAYLLTGSLALDIATDSFIVEGAYIVRDIDPDNKYLILAKIVEPTFSKHLMDIYCTKSTDVVSLKRKSVSVMPRTKNPKRRLKTLSLADGVQRLTVKTMVCGGAKKKPMPTSQQTCMRVST